MIKAAGLILAGGLSSRMGGGDKFLIEAEGETLLSRTIKRLRPQTETILLNANGDSARFEAYDLPVKSDVISGYGGPLVGILTGLEWAENQGFEWMVSVASDTPLFPDDLVERLAEAIRTNDAQIAVAASGGRTHPVFALWPTSLAENLRRAVVEQDMRKIDRFTADFKTVQVDWQTKPFDPFFNVNTPEDVLRLGMILDGALPDPPPLRWETSVGLIIERRTSKNPWGSDVWLPIETVENAPDSDWTLLRRDEDRALYLASGLPLILHRSDLAAYRYNLTTPNPKIYAVLRQNDAAEFGWEAALVTAAPDEAQCLGESGDEIVEGMPMPAGLRQWIELFCACHPPEEPMRKRKRQKYDSDKAFAGDAAR